MRIALIDNMNNNFFVLARYLRDLGIEADLFLIPGRGGAHFDPQNDSWQDLSNAGWIKVFPVGYDWSSYIKPIKLLLKECLGDYDKIIACGPAVGLLKKAGIHIDLFIPYGSDLYNQPFLNKVMGPKKNARWLPSLVINSYRAHLQKAGIQSATKIISNTNWKTAQDAVEELSCTAVNLPRVMVYKEGFSSDLVNSYSWLDNYDFVVFSPTRHLWKTNSDPMPDFSINGGMKRNDKLINAFSRIVSNNLFNNPLLVFCEYGADVEHSKKLILDLGVDRYVKWLPLLPRREIVYVMSKVTFVADQFRKDMSATSAGTTNEALAYGTPVITNADGAIDKIDDPYFGSPILQALTEDEIYQYFFSFAQQPDYYRSIGVASAAWFSKNLGHGLARCYLDLLRN